MRFGNPQLLWTLLALPVFAAIAWYALARTRAALGRIGDAAVVARLFPSSIARWRRRRAAVSLGALALLALAAARPQYGRVEQNVKRAGVDVLVALDVSPSMLAQDVRPDRLTKAKEALKVLIRSLQGNRVGVIAFAGDAFLNCPLTQDLSLADLVLGAIDQSSIGVAGTDLGRAIDVAATAFERGGVGDPILVLVTDGEDNESRGLAKAKEAAKKGMKIFAIGIGTGGGAPVPNPEGHGGFLEKDGGVKVNSRLDMASLEAIAKATGGEAFAAETSAAAAVDAIVRRLGRERKVESESEKVVLHQDRYRWFLWPALLLVLWTLLSRPEPTRIETTDRIGHDPGGMKAKRAIAILAAAGATALLADPAGAASTAAARAKAREGVERFRQEDYDGALEAFNEAARLDPELPGLRYNIGTALARGGRYGEAVANLGGALAESPDADAFYNLGYSMVRGVEQAPPDPNVRLETLRQGLEAFRQAIVANPDDAEAKYNYETTKRMIRKLEEQNEKQDQEGGQGEGEQGEKGEKSEQGEQGEKGDEGEKSEKSEGEKKEGDEESEAGENESEESEERSQSEKSGEQKESGSQSEQQSGLDKPQEEKGEGEGEERRQEQAMNATPTPAPSPGAQPPPGAGGEAEPQATPLTPEQLDALRVLNSLGDQKPEQFKRIFQFRGSRSEDLAQPW